MEMSVADLVTSLENDLAVFYARIKGLPRLRGARDILQQMEDHCRVHALRTAEISRRYSVPAALSVTGITELQARLKRSLSEAIIQEPDPAAVYRQSADAEETVALLYRRIAEHIRSHAAADSPIAEEFDQLAAEELLHRDAILRASEERQGD